MITEQIRNLGAKLKHNALRLFKVKDTTVRTTAVKEINKRRQLHYSIFYR